MPMPMHTQMWSLLVLKMQCNKSCWFRALLTPHLFFKVFLLSAFVWIRGLYACLCSVSYSFISFPVPGRWLPFLSLHMASPAANFPSAKARGQSCVSFYDFPWIPQNSLLVVLSLLSPIFLNICYQLSTYLMASNSLWYSNESQYLS